MIQKEKEQSHMYRVPISSYNQSGFEHVRTYNGAGLSSQTIN